MTVGAPLDHTKVVAKPLIALSVAVLKVQVKSLFLVSVIAGDAIFCVTAMLAVAAQPFTVLVAVTV
jgi:hypothetical protein